MALIPSTKAKQREFLDALIWAIQTQRLPRARILKNLRLLQAQLHNRPPVKRGAVTAQTVTPKVRRQIWSMHRRHPKMTNQDIANRLNLNGGRVSEVLAGKRH